MATLEQLLVPHENVNDDVVVVLHRHVAPGSEVSPGAAIVDIETSKAAITLEAAQRGFVRFCAEPGMRVAVGALLAEIVSTAEEAADADPPTAAPPRAVDDDSEPIFSKAAVAALDRFGVERAAFSGRGNVTARDVEEYAARSKPSRTSEDVDRVALSPSKATEIRVLGGGPGPYTSSVTVALDTNGIFERTNAELSVLRFAVLPLLIQSAARLLRRYPDFNAYYDQGHSVRYRRVDVGIAIDLGAGLRVVRIRSADAAGLREVESAILNAVEQYEANSLRPDDLVGATFTITDLSNDDVVLFAPVVPAKTSAILGVGRIDSEDGRALLTLAFDHRLNAARPAAAFLRELVDTLRQDAPNIHTSAPSCARCFKSAPEDRALGGRGFVPLVEHDGRRVLICGVCLAGY